MALLSISKVLISVPPHWLTARIPRAPQISLKEQELQPALTAPMICGTVAQRIDWELKRRTAYWRKSIP